MINWGAREWAEVMLDRLCIMNWGLPRIIIGDRDRKWMAELWKSIFTALRVQLLYSTAYHQQTDGMSERTNQTAEIALRYYIMALEDPHLWNKILPRMQMALNNSTKYSSTIKAPTEILHGFRAREALDFLRPYEPEQEEAVADAEERDSEAVLAMNEIIAHPAHPQEAPLRMANMNEYRPAHIDAKDAIALAALAMKEYYDQRHQPKYFKVGDYVNLRLHKGYTVPSAALMKTKIQPQFVGPFEIIERIGTLAYRLQLPPTWKIHNVISIAHLEPATAPNKDPYGRIQPPPPPVEVEGEEEFEIERLLRKRTIRRGRGSQIQYLVRWKGYGPEHDQWYSEKDLGNAVELIREYELAYA
jgi:chromodomain-containing protein